MRAALVNDEDKVVQIIPVSGPDEIAQLNQRAQDIADMEWRPATKEDWRKLGENTALFYCTGRAFDRDVG